MTAPVPLTPSCRTCGACCGYVALELEDAEVVPRRTLLRVVYDAEAGGDVLERRLDAAGYLRCYALRGTIGKRVSCSIYARRPTACRVPVPGDEWCLAQRAACPAVKP